MEPAIFNGHPAIRITHIRAPLLPEYRFEYHPAKKKVYAIRVGAEPEIGEVFAHDVESDGAAHNAVLVWLRGYRTAKGEMWDDAGKLIRKDAS